MKVQTRNSEGELQFFDTVKEAFDHADEDQTVWKVSFDAEDGSRVRFVESPSKDGWVFEPII